MPRTRVPLVGAAITAWTKARGWFVARVYADQNQSEAVRRQLEQLFGNVGDRGRILNIGCGTTRLHPRAINCDIDPSAAADLFGDAPQAPFSAGCFDLVIAQEVLEHCPDPGKVVDEVFRVLAADGAFYCQVPFILGYHSGPEDYWRFTRAGLPEVLKRGGFERVVVGASLGPSAGLYRICVEYAGLCGERLNSRLYIPCKAAASVALYPIKWLDLILAGGYSAHRLAGGFYASAYKPGG